MYPRIARSFACALALVGFGSARGEDLMETSFDAPPKVLGGQRATDAPLLGNGDLAVCLSGPPDKQVFWVTKNDFWFLANGHCQTLNFGSLNLAVPALAGAAYSVRQSLNNATTHAVFTGDGVTLNETIFVAATANVMVVNLQCTGKPLEIAASFAPTTYDKNEERKAWDSPDGTVHFASRGFTQGADIPTAATVAWKSSTGTAKFVLEPNKPVTLLLSMASNFDGGDHAERAQTLLAKADAVALEKAHSAWWKEFWGKSTVEIPDHDILRRYQISLYTMASGSRNAKFPPAIIGPWMTAREGWVGYWMNYNHAAPFYGLYSSNHIEQADPQDAPLLDFLPSGGKCASIVFDGKMRGVLYPVGLGPLGINHYGYGKQEVTNNRIEKGITTWGQRSNAAYNLVNMAQRWYTTYDPAYGRKILPYARAVTDFWEDYLVKEDDGKGGYRYSVVGDSVQEGTGKNRNPGITLALVRQAFLLALDLGKELGVDANRRAKREDILTHLAPLPTIPHGGKPHVFVLAEDMPRFWGDNTVHMQSIYPGNAVGLDSPPELLQTARDTLAVAQRWHDQNGSNSFFPGAARVGYDPAVILAQLKAYSTARMSPNGFSKGNIHGIENCSTVPNTVNEMLMQSHEGVIRFFPVWPKELEARFATLRAYGAFLVSARLKSGVVDGVELVSERGRDCVIVNPWPDQKVRVTRSGKPAETVQGARFTLKTSLKETLTLAPL